MGYGSAWFSLKGPQRPQNRWRTLDRSLLLPPCFPFHIFTIFPRSNECIKAISSVSLREHDRTRAHTSRVCVGSNDSQREYKMCIERLRSEVVLRMSSHRWPITIYNKHNWILYSFHLALRCGNPSRRIIILAILGRSYTCTPTWYLLLVALYDLIYHLGSRFQRIRYTYYTKTGSNVIRKPSIYVGDGWYNSFWLYDYFFP